MSITENKNDINEYITALKDKWFNNYDNLSALQKGSDILSKIEFWVKEIIIEDIADNGIDNDEDFETYFNPDYDHVSSRFMEDYTETNTLLIKDVDDIMSYCRNELPEYIYESDYYEEVKECFYKTFDVVIYNIAKEMWDYLSDDIIKFKKIIEE
jgi:hypothetical protein